jgi:hypothetical protein
MLVSFQEFSLAPSSSLNLTSLQHVSEDHMARPPGRRGCTTGFTLQPG